MTRNTRRNTFVLGCLVSLSLLHWLWPTAASQPVAFDSKILDTFVARNIGPANMGGRIVALAVPEGQPNVIYVGSASGGLFKSSDSGDTFQPVFDQESSVTVGDVAVSASNPDIVWVGTGEHNARNSVAWGDGVYKSTDGGKSWKHMGLKDSHTIGRIAIHPKNPDIVYVAVLGHLWGPNRERGIFKTTDGGKTWQLSKFLDESTGFVDLKMDPTDPDTLYACAYCVRRDAFSAGNPAILYGPHAGLYKTADGGKSWEKMTEGLPANQYGRCGIDIYRKDPNVVYAVVQTDKTKIDAANGGGVPNGKGGPEDGGIFRSDDKGKTWKHLNTLCPRPFYYGQIRVDPSDDNRIYVLGVQIFISNDGAKTFGGGGGKGGGKGGGTHSDHHALWVNPQNSEHVILGNDGGLYFSKDKAKSWEAVRKLCICQFYGISVDMRKPYYVHGGLQDNGCWVGPSANHSEGGIRLAEWRSINGGDGFHTQCDPTDPYTVYAESQYGNPKRVNLKGGGKGGGVSIGVKGIASDKGKEDPEKKDKDQDKKDQDKKDPEKKDQPKGGKGGKGGGKGGAGIRFNWSTPMLLSPHDSKTLYYGGNFLFVSTERGDSWKKISPDLTYGGPGAAKGGGAHSLFTICESPKKKGVLWTGSDDGRVHVSKDGGETWKDVSKIPGMPKDSCVSRVEASSFDEATCYVSITRYRNDDRKPYVFKTTDYGATWTTIAGNLPDNGSVHVVIESNRNKNLLFAGTEFGLFVSLTGGNEWHRMRAGLPTVAVHDLIIHPRDRDLVIGTHGRGIYVIDDISPLEQLAPEALTKVAYLFEVRPAVAHKVQPSPGPTKQFVGQNPPYGAMIRYHLKNAPGKAVSIAILDATGKQVASLPGADKAGMHQVVWDLRAQGDEGTVRPGDYQALLDFGGQKQLRTIRVDAE